MCILGIKTSWSEPVKNLPKEPTQGAYPRCLTKEPSKNGRSIPKELTQVKPNSFGKLYVGSLGRLLW